MSQLPIIDISEIEAGEQLSCGLANQLSTALHEVGFVALLGHGIPSRLIEAMRAETQALFALPSALKLAMQVSPTNYRGYVPLGFFSPNAKQGTADQYEAFKLHAEIEAGDLICQQCDLYGPNRWPQARPSLKATVMEYWGHCNQLNLLLLDALFGCLSLSKDCLETWFDKPLSNMTLLHYPAKIGSGESSGIHPHKDTDALTFLLPDPVGGLYLRPRQQADWFEAHAPNGAMIVNVGDMLETWSGGYYVSTPHKVINTSQQDRYSFPYFSVPRFDTVIRPLGKSNQIEQIEPALYHDAGTISAKIWRSNWPDAAAIEACFDPYSH